MGLTSVDNRALRYFSEFLGTFLFLSVILVYAGTQYAGFPIGMALAVMIFALGYISGGHFNPAVSTMFAVNGTIDWIDWAFYVVLQIAGGICALYYWKAAKHLEFVPPNFPSSERTAN